MRLNRSEVGLETFPALFSELSNLRDMLDNPLLESDWTSQSAACAWISSFTPLPFLQASASWANVEERIRAGKQSERQKGWRIRETQTGKKRREKGKGKLYLDNLIISHLQSTSMDAPSLHHAAHCEERASVAGQPVDFPLSLSQRGPACPYISRSGHADSDGHPSAATTLPLNYDPSKKKKNKMMHWSYLHVNSEIHPPGRVVVSTALRTDIHMYNCTATLWEQWPYINSNTWA